MLIIRFGRLVHENLALDHIPPIAPDEEHSGDDIDEAEVILQWRTIQIQHRPTDEGEIDADERLVIVSGGREQNVSAGYQGLILGLRGGLRGKFTVMKVFPRLSGAKIDTSDSPIEKGDLALVVAKPEAWGFPTRDALALIDSGSKGPPIPGDRLTPRDTDRVTRRLGLRGAGSDSVGSPRAIRTTVNAIDSSEGLVVLAAGRDDGVEVGYEFTVARGDTFVGKVKVIRVYPNLSGAKVLWVREGLPIQRGDTATTGAQ